MVLPVWPDSLRPSRGGRPVYVPRNVGGTVALSGFGQVVTADAGTWKFPYENIPIRGWRHIQTWDTLVLRLEGRLNPFIVRICEGRRQPFPPGVGPLDPIPHSDDAFFLDGSGYTQPVIIAELDDDLALGATTAAILRVQCGDIEPAHFFSIGDRLYQVRDIISVVGDVTTVRFLPPARVEAEAEDAVEFERPRCKVRLATDAEMDRVLDLNRLGSLSVTMHEDQT